MACYAAFMYRAWISSCLLSLAVSVGAQEAVRPLIFVTIPPQRWLVRELAGASFDTQLLVAPGRDPHSFEPTARQLAALARARAWLTIGLPCERPLLAKARGARPDLREVATHAGLRRRQAEHHHHGDDGADDGADPHVWLAPGHMARIATNTCRALVEIDPGNGARYAAALAELTRRLAVLHAELAAELQPVKGGSFWVYHPSWGYFAEEYGLRQVAIEEEGRAPAARQLARLVAAARASHVGTIFADPQYDPAPVNNLARQMKAAVVMLDPLAEDWERNLRAVARAVRRGATSQH